MMAVNRRISFNGKQPDQVSEDCIICCEKVTDKAFVNNCLHYFCLKCIKEWVKVRAVCPLCVQPIVSIINNVRSADDYDLQPVVPPETDVLANYQDADIDLWEAVYDYEDDFNDDVELSSDETHAVNSSTDSDDDPINDYHHAMDEDSFDDSDDSFGDAETSSFQGIDLFSNTEDEEEEEEVKSLRSSDSDMEEDGWQIGETEFENSYNDDCENDSDENGVELSDCTYYNLCDSDDNDSLPNSPSAYIAFSESPQALSESAYEYDVDDYDHDDTYADISDSEYY